MATTATEASVYRQGNTWQCERYAHMAEVNADSGIRRFGPSKLGAAYQHLLHPDDALHNFLGDERTLRAVRDRFAGHKAGDLQRALTNMVASQPCCFNLFAPLWRDRQLTDRLFSALLDRPVQVQHLEIEFTPNTWVGLPGFERHADESIGDQSERAGTDADVAVFYTDGNGRRGVVLIEFKYIEAEFSTCGSYRSPSKGPRIRAGCDAADWYAQRIAPHLAHKPKQPDCGYLKYANWDLLERSSVLDAAAVKALPGCPFKGGMNQIWRNLLLAERVAEARRLDEFHFWVLSPVQNTYLWQEAEGDVLERIHGILTPQGHAAFRKLELEREVITPLEQWANAAEQRAWLQRFRERYLP